MPELSITQMEKGKQVKYVFENDFNKFTLTGNVLKADTVRYKYNVNVKDVLKVSIRDGNHLLGGLAYGALGGFVFGFIIGISMPRNPPPSHDMGFSIPGGFGTAMVLGLLLAIPPGLIGGIIGLLSPNYESYELPVTDIAKKKSEIVKVFRKWGKIIP